MKAYFEKAKTYAIETGKDFLFGLGAFFGVLLVVSVIIGLFGLNISTVTRIIIDVCIFVATVSLGKITRSKLGK